MRTFLIPALLISLFSCGKNSCVEKVKEDCSCLEIYEPVCGCNGVTYPNSCYAECKSITKYTPGICE